jgi:signal transduction histidine kinase
VKSDCHDNAHGTLNHLRLRSDDLDECSGLGRNRRANEGEGMRSPHVEQERRRVRRLIRSLREARLALEATDDGVAAIAHELRAPLTSLRLLTEDMLEEGHRPRRVAGDWIKEAGHLHQIAAGMAATLDSLVEAVALSRGHTNWGIVDIEACASAAAALVQPQAAAAVQIHIAIHKPVAPVRGDAEAIRRLLVNLLVNACRHTERGRIDVSVETSAPGWLKLVVSDTGSGIDAGLLKRIGQPFARRRGGSAGLGLWICRGIAAAHGGELSLTSAPGQGTTCCASLRSDLAGPVMARAVPPVRVVAAPSAGEAA